jgi:hypothetical protein
MRPLGAQSNFDSAYTASRSAAAEQSPARRGRARAVEPRRHHLTLEWVRATMRGVVERISRRVFDAVQRARLGMRR